MLQINNIAKNNISHIGHDLDKYMNEGSIQNEFSQ